MIRLGYHELFNVCITTVCFLLTSCPTRLWQLQLGYIHPGLALHFSVFTEHVVASCDPSKQLCVNKLALLPPQLG